MKDDLANENLFVEQAYLSTIVMFPEHFIVNQELLVPTNWIKSEKYKHAYEVIIELIERNSIPELPIVLTILKERKKETVYYEIPSAAELSTPNASIHNINGYLFMLKEFYAKDKLTRISFLSLRKNDKDFAKRLIDVRDICNEAIQEISTSKKMSFKNSANSFITNLETELSTINSNAYCKAGIASLDDILISFFKGMLYITAGRPGMGKTAFATSVIDNVAFKQKKKVLFFSIEMSFDEIIGRMASFKTEIDGARIKKKQLEKGEFLLIKQEIQKMIDTNTLIIDDTPALAIEELKAKAISLKAKENIEMVVIDYLQIIRTMQKGKTREQEVTYISNELKALSKQIDCPVICLAQLSRDVEKRGGSKKPQLSDLRESGAIEQDADVVMFLYRPEYYGFFKDSDGNSLKGKAEIIVAKHRGGSLGSAFVTYKAQFTKFCDESQQQMEELFPEIDKNSQEQLF